LFAVAATVAALLLAAGCGSSSGSSGDGEVTVQTGSLSKAAFVKKADAICESARAQFDTTYASFVKAHTSELSDKQKEAALLGEMVNSVIPPPFEQEIAQISELGAPDGYASEVASFLNAVQKRLAELQENPAQLSASPYVFKKAEDAAKKAGLPGCAESFG
jgi:hypothetical protein